MVPVDVLSKTGTIFSFCVCFLSIEERIPTEIT